MVIRGNFGIINRLFLEYKILLIDNIFIYKNIINKEL